MADAGIAESLSVAESSVHGRGVFAATQLDEGCHIGTYTGRPTAIDGIHVLWVEGDDDEFTGIDGDGVLRWLNHSRTPNVEFDGPELYSLRAIEAGEELLFHYGDEWADTP